MQTAPSYLQWFIAWWILALCTAIAFAYFGNPLFPLFPVYVLSTWIPFVIISFCEQRRLLAYLRENHKQTWKSLFTVPGFPTPGGYRMFRFLLSPDNLSDPVVAAKKMRSRRVLYLGMSMMFHYPLVLGLLVGLAIEGRL